MRKIKTFIPFVIFIIAPVVIIGTMFCSILLGAKAIPVDVIWEAIFQFDEKNVDHQIIRFSRIPRALGALLIGCFLAISGSIMQGGMTRNYLASPSIMGGCLMAPFL